METSSMPAFIWRLLLVFFISVPNSRFIAIGIETSTTKTPSSHSRSSATATATTTAFATSSLEKSLHNKSILMTQSDVQTTFPITLSARTIVGSSLLTTETTAYAVERKVSDVNFSGVTTDSLHPSMTENSTVNAFAEVAATTTAAIQATFTTTPVTTAAQVTKATEWGTDTKNNGSNKENVQKMSSNRTYEASSNSSTKAKPSSRVREQQGGQETVSREVAFGTSKQYVRQVYQELPATTGTSPAGHNNRVDDKHQLGGSNGAVDATTATLSTPTAAHSSLNDGSSRGSSKNILTPAEAMVASSSSSAITAQAAATAMTSTTTTPTTTTTMKPWLPPPVDGYQTIISQAGTHAYLPCNVKQLVRKPISWLRVRDGHILTVDQTTFIADQRFQSVYSPNPERWSLQIKYVQTKDAGTYECQLSTEPKTSAIVTLLIVEPKTELIGESTRHVKVGSQVKLRCIITQALEPPLFINWFHNQKQIYLHNRRDWRTEMERIELTTEIPAAVIATAHAHAYASESITVSAAKPNHRPKVGTATSPSSLLPTMQSSMARLSTGRDRTLATAITAPRSTTTTTTTRVQRGPLQRTSTVATDVKQITTASLIIPSVEKQDSGNYTCSPSNSAPMTVVLHVLSGEYSASAITSGMSRIGQKDSLWFHAATILMLLWILLLLQQLNFGREKRTVKTSKGAKHLYRLLTTTTTKLTTTRIVFEVFEEKT